MKQNKRKTTIAIQDPLSSFQQFYDPFTNQTAEQISKEASKKTTSFKCSMALFQDGTNETTDEEDSFILSQEQVELNVMKPVNFNKFGIFKGKDDPPIKSSILSKVIANTKNPKKQPSRLPSIAYKQNQQGYGFNTRDRVVYPQTPGFKSLLQSPFGKFNHLFKDIISTLSKNTDVQLDSKNINFDAVPVDANPLSFYNAAKMSFETSKYFVGIATKFKETNCLYECLYFYHLACYADPFNDKPWKKYVSILEEQGKLEKACIMAKCGFLLTQSQDLIKSFLSNGEKCGLPLFKLQGIICSVSNPQIFQKSLLPESAKLQIKYGVSWKGLKVVFQICKSNQFKLSVCQHTLFLAKYIENMGFVDEAMSILKQSFSKSMSKLQIYLLYLEMSMRKNHCLIESDLQQVMKYVDCISGQNRFRLFLEISLILYKFNDEKYYIFLWNAFNSALDFCAPGTGCSKALKQIYFSYSKILGLMPSIKSVEGDQVVFQINRYNFIKGKPLIEYEFTDWKYYLHYGVAKRHDLLAFASKKWAQTGRIIAEWIHCLRQTKPPLQMLKIWREKINQVPKSGQLWCEGGRIFVDLGEYQNASKCFKYAMHFTPQYGDSFIEELRILLKESRFLQINKLKKLFLVCEPFYGHVLSYLKLNHWSREPLNLKYFYILCSQVWDNSVYEISQDLYQSEGREKEREWRRENGCHTFTAYMPYNIAYLNWMPNNERERQNLFSSYEQMENKN